MKKINDIAEIVKKSRFVKISRIITTSATFALLLSIVFFVCETWNNKKDTHILIDNLLQIQNSLSTRYLGLFPEYIANIDVLLSMGTQTSSGIQIKADTVIIFEDVLYYGIKSRPNDFLKLNKLLWQLAQDGCQIFIAYYHPNGKAFKQMIRETLIVTPFLSNYEQDMQSYFVAMHKINYERERILATIDNPTQQQRDSVSQILYSDHLDSILHIGVKEKPHLTQNMAKKSRIVRFIDPFKMVDSLKCEEYFQQSVLLDQKEMLADIKQYLKPMSIKADAQIGTAEYFVNNLAQQLDSVKHVCIGTKQPQNITFADYKSMYVGFTHTLEDFYQSCGKNVHLIPLNDYLTMSCWMISGNGRSQAIFAFPSKYATEEIGFYSQDEAIANYIRTMLRGVQVAQSK